MGGLKILAHIGGSRWFVFVSFALALFAGIHLIARLDTRDATRGEPLHPFAAVAVAPGKDGKPFELVPMTELARLREQGVAYSLSMPAATARIETGPLSWAVYRVQERQGDSQLIEVEASDDDGSLWTRYRVDGDAVAPLSTRMFHHGYLFAALPHAAGVSLLIFATGRFLRHRLRARQAAPPLA